MKKGLAPECENFKRENNNDVRSTALAATYGLAISLLDDPAPPLYVNIAVRSILNPES
jgi:hypothetical protein